MQTFKFKDIFDREHKIYIEKLRFLKTVFLEAVCEVVQCFHYGYRI